MLKLIDSFQLLLNKINKVLVYIIKIFIALLIAGMSICVLLAVISRYALKIPLPWTEEMARFLMIWAAFLSSTLGLKRGLHVGIVFLIRRMSKNLQLYLDILSKTLVSIFFIFVIWQGFKLSTLVSHQISPVMRISMSWVYISLPISALILLIFNIDLFLDSFSSLINRTNVESGNHLP